MQSAKYVSRILWGGIFLLSAYESEEERIGTKVCNRLEIGTNNKGIII